MASNSRLSERAKGFSDLAETLLENLTKATAKNEYLLEAIESSEAKVKQGGAEAPFLKDLRARLAATHAPNAALRRDLAKFKTFYDRLFKELDDLTIEYETLVHDLKIEKSHLEEQKQSLKQKIDRYEQEKGEWKQKLEEAKIEIEEQNDRLTILADQLSGDKVALDAQTKDLAFKRLAFEEEKLDREGDEFRTADTEAEELRQKLRKQIIKNADLEDKLLHCELTIHQKEEGMGVLNATNERLQRSLVQARQASTKAIKQFDKRTNEANRKLADMTTELAKSQQHAKRFQDMLSIEHRKQKGLRHALEKEMKRNADNLSSEYSSQAQKAYLDTLADSLALPNKPRNSLKVEDVVRRNEQMTIENANLKAEIRRLKVENSEMTKSLGQARINDHYMRNQVSTNIADRIELQKRLERIEIQYRELQSSLTKQATDWVSDKRRRSKSERTTRWKQIEPIDVFGGSDRLWSTLPQTGSRKIVQKE